MVNGLRHRAAVALRAAIHFLEQSADDGAWWRDFDLFGVPSDEWTTAYAGSALAETGQSSAVAMARDAWSRLERRSAGRPGGFGYSGESTRDADSTVWACRLARSVGAESSAASMRALSFLRECVCPDGGMRTYRTAEELRQSIGFPVETTAEGWLRSHACVTAASAILPELSENAREYLRRAQTTAGRWESYWWTDWEFATAYAMEAMTRSGDSRDRVAVERAADAIVAAQNADTPFAAALRVLALSRAARECSQTLEMLLSSQLADGSWPPSARLRMPAPWIRDPSECWYWDYNRQNFGCIRLDCSRIFGTATAVRAMNAWLNA